MCYVSLAGSGGEASPSLKDFRWPSDSYYVAKTGLKLVDPRSAQSSPPNKLALFSHPTIPCSDFPPIKTELFPPNPTQFVEAEETLIYAGKYRRVNTTLPHWEEDSRYFKVFPSVSGSEKPFSSNSCPGGTQRCAGIVGVCAAVLTAQFEIGYYR